MTNLIHAPAPARVRFRGPMGGRPALVTVMALATFAAAQRLGAQAAPVSSRVAAPLGDSAARAARRPGLPRTPVSELRELDPDRPDRTEGPTTVDVGHVQFEVEAFDVARDRDRGIRSTEMAFGHTTVRVGVLPNVDLHLVVETFTVSRQSGPGAPRETTSGFGDLTPRLKLNLWGNDGGGSAGAILPFVKLPTAREGIGNDAVEGGVIFPVTFSLPAGFDLGAMTEIDAKRDDEGDARHAAWINSASLGRDLTSRLGAYLELYGEYSARPGIWATTVDGGVKYRVSRDVILDAGVDVGASHAADDLLAFVGFTIRR
ncbi:MAG TPA: transporter [Gemmatimonadaceae bacterium]|nr:transporter [Gemmatimonadaceae bacterium]